MHLASHESLAMALGRLLDARGIKVTAAESCTGGGIASAITSVPGSSRWFEQAFVCYSNTAKEQLGVSPSILREHGAVSEACVRALLAAALERSGADVGVAVSGIAGPDGGTLDKPVGTVYFAWGGSRIEARRFQFPGDRASVRSQSVDKALELLIDYLQTTV